MVILPHRTYVTGRIVQYYFVVSGIGNIDDQWLFGPTGPASQVAFKGQILTQTFTLTLIVIH